MDTWKEALQEIKASDKFQTLIKTVYRLYETRTVYPPKADLFNALRLTPFQDVKIVILGQDPYHQKHQAHGLAFSVNETVRVPPSLKNIFKELHTDLGIEVPKHGNLTKWARQGVLLLNTILTVEASRPASHKSLGWQWFTDQVIKQLNRHEKPIVFLLWGNHAKSKATLIDKEKHLVLKASHPSPLGAHHSFFGCRHFSKANAFLKRNNREPVDFSI